MSLLSFLKRKTNNHSDSNLQIKSNKTQSTIKCELSGSKAKGRQSLLDNLNTYHDPLKVYPDIKNGKLNLLVGKSSSKIIGTIDSKIVNNLVDKYYKSGSLLCDLEIGNSYTITKDNDDFYKCSIELTIIT